MKAKITEVTRKRTSPRGKTKQNLGIKPKCQKPLDGKHLFLDLKGYRGAVKLEENLKLLGAKIENSFSTDTNILITNSGSVKDYEKKNKYGMPASPGISTPSPFNPGWTQDIDSPQESPGLAEKRPISRARAIVTKAKVTQNYGSTNIIEWAKQWKIRIVHADKVKTWVSKELEKLPAVKDAAKQAKKTNCKQTQVRRLRGNYVKFEASNCHYKPIQQQLETAPRVMFDTPVFSCPFEKKSITSAADDEIRELRAECEGQQDSKKESIGQSAKQQREKSSASGEYGGGKLMTAGELRKFIREKLIKEAKRGYCEMCKVKYDNIDQHVKCESHKKFVREKNNYSSLDAMISAGPNLDQFLNDVIRYHKLHMQEGIKMMAKEDNMSGIKQSGTKKPDIGGKKLATQHAAPETSQSIEKRKPSANKNPSKQAAREHSVIKDSDTSANKEAKLTKETEVEVEKLKKQIDKSEIKQTEKVTCVTSSKSNTADQTLNDKKTQDNFQNNKTDLDKTGSVKLKNSNSVILDCDIVNSKQVNANAEVVDLKEVKEIDDIIKVSQEEEEIFRFSHSLPAIPVDKDAKCDTNLNETSSQRSKRTSALGDQTKNSKANKLVNEEMNANIQNVEAICKTPIKGDISMISVDKASPSSNKRKQEGTDSDHQNKKSLTSQKRKKRLVKLKRNWSLLSDRSMQKLLMTSEEDGEHFMGFQHPVSNMSHNPATDVSFVNVDEVEIVENSEIEWVVEEYDEETASERICKENVSVTNKTKKRKPSGDIFDGKKQFTTPLHGEVESPSQVMTSTPVHPKKKRLLSPSDLSQDKNVGSKSNENMGRSPSRLSTRIAAENPVSDMKELLCKTPRAAYINAKEKILQASLSPKQKSAVTPTAKRKLIPSVKHGQKSSAAPCILSLDQVMSMKSKDHSDSGKSSISVKGSNKFLKTDRSSKGTSYKFSYLPGCNLEQRKLNEKKRTNKAKTVLSPKQNQNKNVDNSDKYSKDFCDSLKRKLSPKKIQVRTDKKFSKSNINLRRSPRKACSPAHRKVQTPRVVASNVTYEFMGSSEVECL